MKILLTKILFISLFLSAGAPAIMQAGESNSVEAVAEVVNPLKRAKFFIENNAPRAWSCLNKGVDNIDNFLKESPEKAGIYAAGTAVGCYLAYKAYHSKTFKPVKEKVACMWDNIKYLSYALLFTKGGITLGKTFLTSSALKNYLKNMSKGRALILEAVLKGMAITGVSYLIEIQSYILGRMPLLKGMNKDCIHAISSGGTVAAVMNALNLKIVD